MLSILLPMYEANESLNTILKITLIMTKGLGIITLFLGMISFMSSMHRSYYSYIVEHTITECVLFQETVYDEK